jgi:hypothetical protein
VSHGFHEIGDGPGGADMRLSRSIASVTLMIAGEMTRESLQRQQRMAVPMEDCHAT